MLTPEQLEDAARKLCKIRGIDPDSICPGCEVLSGVPPVLRDSLCP